MDGAGSFLEAYMAPIMDLVKDPSIVEIAINSDGQVWLESQGAAHMELHPLHRFTTEAARQIGGAIASTIQLAISSDKPVLSGKIELLGVPMRAQVLIPPAVEEGCAITLRSYSQKKIAIEKIELLHGTLVDLDQQRKEKSEKIRELADKGEIERAMRLCVDERLNVMISGGTSSGKTTFARGLLDLVDNEERIVTIEDAFELFPDQPNSLCLKAKRMEKSETSAAKLLEATLRLRPDRIILGELRGSECKTFLDAINTGHGGSFTTIHADTAKKAIDRLALMVMSVGMNMNFEEVRRYCENSIDVVVQLGRENGKRGVAEIYIPSS